MSKKKKRDKTGWPSLVATLEAMHCERQARMAAYEARKAAETFKPTTKPELSPEQRVAVSDLSCHLTMVVNDAVVAFEHEHPEIGLYARLMIDPHIHTHEEQAE